MRDVTADLRAGIEALIVEPFIYRLDNGHTNIGTPPVVLVSDLDALLAAHPVQGTTAAEMDALPVVAGWHPASADEVLDEVERRLRNTGWSSVADDRCRVALLHIDAYRTTGAMAPDRPAVTPREHDPRCERRAHDSDTPCVWRERACVENWSGCESGDYNPACCRFPKSCTERAFDQFLAEQLLDPEVRRGYADQGWTETDLRPYLDQLAQYAKELASLTATTSDQGETP